MSNLNDVLDAYGALKAFSKATECACVHIGHGACNLNVHTNSWICGCLAYHVYAQGGPELVRNQSSDQSDKACPRLCFRVYSTSWCFFQRATSVPAHGRVQIRTYILGADLAT